MAMKRSIWIGYDPREAAAFAVARSSARKNSRLQYPINGVILRRLEDAGLYTRPWHRDLNNQMFDDISAAPMSTEFAISRFFVPLLAKQGWALFMDSDVLVRGDITDLMNSLDSSKAVMCVQHDYTAKRGTKMDGQVQTSYKRKNWSSVMAFNCDHEANKSLTAELLNTARGRDLHQFCWLKDEDIGALDPAWNWLAGEQPEPEGGPKIVHHTLGSPCLPGFEDVPYAHEWRAELERWAQ